MLIRQDVLCEIIQKMPTNPPEAGGIIGGNRGSISVWEFDEGYKECGCVYRPNVNYLNDVISKWSDNDIEFLGIFHSHFGGARTLSLGDVEYITRIMKSMPTHINLLYFPIVVQPNSELVPYMATIDAENNVEIKEDELEII